MNKQEERSIPNWLIFIFSVVLIVGALHFIYRHVFSQVSNIDESLYKMRFSYAIPSIEIIPMRTELSIAEGEKIYSQVCLACHGIYGENKTGLIGPNLADNVWLHSNREEDMNRLITQGISQPQSITGGVMPARAGANLNTEKIWQVIYYLSSKNSSIEQKKEDN